MKKQGVSSSDEELIAAAIKVVKRPVRLFNGEKAPAYVGAALRLEGGKIITSVNLMTDLGSLSVCAEPIAIAEAAHEHPDKKIKAIVAVYCEPGQEPRVIAPCGRCREAITDYALRSFVILREPKTQKFFKVKAEELLPLRYATFWRKDKLV